MATLLEAAPITLTYEAYMAEPITEGRYDIINGVRIFMPGGTYRHQRIASNIGRLFYYFEQQSGLGNIVSAPYDVLIRRRPRLQTRQPDVLFVSHARLAQGGGIPEIGPLEVAPELVVEIISDSETQRRLNDKLMDYIAIGVDECWVVRPNERTVEVLALTPDGPQSVRVYTEPEMITSRIFATLSAATADIFAP